MKAFTLGVHITAFDKITAPLQRITGRIQAVTAPARALSNQFASFRHAAGVDVLSDKLRGVTGALNGISAAATRTATRIAGIGLVGAGVAYGFKRQFVDTAANFEQMEARLEGLEGTKEKARGAFDFITGLSLKSPFNMDAITDGFQRLRMNGIDPTNGSLQGMADFVAKVGGTSDVLNGVTNAFGQMVAKGTLSAEEMQQLAERNVPAWELLQRTIERVHGRKLEIPQLRKMAEGGAFGKPIMLEMIKQMGIDSAGAAERMSKTWTGMLTGLGTRWNLFKRQVMLSGPFQKLTEHLRRLLESIDQMTANGTLQRWADWLGAKFLSAFVAIERAVRWAFSAEGRKSLNDLIEKFKGLFRAVDVVRDLLGLKWKTVGLLAFGAYIGGPLLASVFSATAAVIGLAVAIGVTPVGWLLLGIGAIGIAGLALIARWQEISDAWTAIWKDIKKAVGGFVVLAAGTITADLEAIVAGWISIFEGFRDTVLRTFVLMSKLTPRGMVDFAMGKYGDFKAGLHYKRDEDIPLSDATPGAAAVSPIMGGFNLPFAQYLQSAAPIFAPAMPGGAAAPFALNLPQQRELPGVERARQAIGVRDELQAAARDFRDAVREFKNARVRVDFNNAPIGTRVDRRQAGPIDFSTRVLMGPTTAGAW